MTRRLTRAEIEAFFERLKARNPHPTTELDYTSPYTLLIAVVLSAQATDRSVNKVTPHLFAEADTPARMVALGEERLADHIKTIGLYRSKAKNIIALSRALLAEHGGQVPASRASLEALPGVGRKTANVVLNTAFGEPTIAVDTHLFRVANRTGLASGKTPREVEDALLARVPQRFLKDAHHWLILHGRYVCTARAPKCPECVVADLCRYPLKAKPLEATRSPAPQPAPARRRQGKTRSLPPA